MKMSELVILVLVIALFSTSFFGVYNLLSKEKIIFSIQETYQMLCFINSDFIAKSREEYFLSKINKEDWLLFIKNYFSLDTIQLNEKIKNESYLYSLQFSINGEVYLINYAGRFNEKNSLYERR